MKKLFPQAPAAPPPVKEAALPAKPNVDVPTADEGASATSGLMLPETKYQI